MRKNRELFVWARSFSCLTGRQNFDWETFTPPNYLSQTPPKKLANRDPWFFPRLLVSQAKKNNKGIFRYKNCQKVDNAQQRKEEKNDFMNGMMMTCDGGNKQLILFQSAIVIMKSQK